MLGYPDSVEATRLRVLSGYAILDTPHEAFFDDLVALAAELCTAPIAVLTFLDHRRQWFKASIGLDVRETPREIAFCDHTIRGGARLVVSDPVNDERFRKNPLVTGAPHIRFYAGAPLISPEGISIGSIAVVDRIERSLSDGQMRALQTLARLAMDQLEQRIQKNTQALHNPRAEIDIQRQAAFARFNPNPVLELSAQGEINYFNDAAGRMARTLGFPHPREILPAETAEIVVACLATGLPRLRLETQTGERTISWSFFPIRQLNTVHCYAGDITDRKQAEAAMHRSEERFRNVAKATNDAIWDWDLATNSLWWNEGFTRLLGFDQGEIAPGIESWITRIHPDDCQAIMRDIHAAIHEGREFWTGEYRVHRKDGSIALVRDRGHIIRDASGKAVRMVVGMTDLTEQKAAEARLREQAELLDKAQDAILVRGLDHRITYWNKSAERLYGWTAEESLGCSVVDLLRAETEAFQQAHARVLEAGEWFGELRKIARDGRTLVIAVRWSLVRDDDGIPRSILAINTDITEKKNLELQFLRAQRMESIGTLAGGIAHDLNNVLAPITMGLDLLRMNVTNAQDLDLLETMQSSATHGSEMIRQVLSYARGKAGRRVDVAARDLIQDIEKIARDTFPKNIQIETRVCPDLWTLTGDPTQLHQILLNLVINARDALPHGGHIVLEAKNIRFDNHYAAMNIDAKAGPYLLIQVEDNGTGIPRAIVDKIFDPFFTTKPPGKGTGLGLSTTMAIVKGHGGFLRVHSEPDQGTRFSIYLPARSERHAPSPSSVLTPMLRGKGETILVVDDEAAIRQVTQNTLRQFGYEVLLASDGSEAVALYAEHRAKIALVFTDMMMPVMDGPATIHALCKINPRVLIIATSGAANATSDGAIKRFLPKPYTTKILLESLREVLDAPP